MNFAVFSKDLLPVFI